MLEDRILFIDGEAIVVDKPAGLPVDPPRRGGDSLSARLAELRCGFRSSPVPMHRLDQDTSGCLLLARNSRARAAFQHAFEERRVRKYYVAVIAGEIGEESGVIEIPLSKRSSAEAGWRMVGDPGGQQAVTNWRCLAVRHGSSLVEFQPVTGRTHQIRVHAREGFGRGIVGDRVYGVPGGPMLLHASRLVVLREKYGMIDAMAPLPSHFGEWRDAA
ncbi:MAG TPA: RNA pseudouridine synthase [Sphingomicrobium sp.]|nr:RNA pseudouridine synthase [Sphingomicrobium sp.]